MKNMLIIFTAIALVIFAISQVVIYYFSTFGELGDQKSDWGTFGDFIGGTLNPLLSFLGFCALLYTIFIQRKQIDDDKKDREKQQFESTFFSLLNVHNQTLANLGREIVFDKLKEIAGKKDWEDDSSYFLNPKEETNLRDASSILKRNNHLFGHYFQILYQLLKFIAVHSHDNKIGLDFDAEKIKNNAFGLNEKMYSNIVRSTLHEDLMRLLAINCYCEDTQDDYHKYKLLVERYALFEHASFNPKHSISNIANNFPAIEEIRTFYDKKAFGL